MQLGYISLASGTTRAWLTCILALLLALASTSMASGELKLRERIIALEDERDALQDKYETLSAEYKTVKGEIRASIDLQSRLDDALAEVAELQSRSGAVNGLQRGLDKCENARENTLVDLMLTESSLNEMIRKYRELELQVHKEDCSAIKRDLVQYRDQAEQCMTDVEGLKKNNGELSKRAAEQAAKLAELEDVEGDLIKASAELEVAVARNEELIRDSAALKELEKEHVGLQAQMKSVASSLEASKNELTATKAALNGLLDSLDSRLQLEALKEAHEKEILPFWLDSLLMRLLGQLQALYVKHVQQVFVATVETADGARMFFVDQIDLLRKGTSEAIHSVVHPLATRADGVLGKDVLARKLFDRAIEACSRHLGTLNSQRKRLHVFAGVFQRASVRFIGNKLSVALTKIPYFDNRQEGMDIHAISTGIFYAFVAMLTLPLVVMTAKSVFNALLYYFRTGTAVVVVPNESETIDMIEESIGYKFRNRDLAVQALEKSLSLYQVGLAIINLILANELKGTDSKKEVEQRSMLSCVDKIVRPGPGRKSIVVAKEQKAYMYVCLLAAVFRDSDESVETVMRVWGNSSDIPTDLEVTNDRYIPTIEDDDEDEMPDLVHSGRSSSSSVSVGEAPSPEGAEGQVDADGDGHEADDGDHGDDCSKDAAPEHDTDRQDVAHDKSVTTKHYGNGKKANKGKGK